MSDEFKSVAGLCAVALGAANTDTAWAEWVDCLRRERVAFKVGELRLDSRPTEPRPEPDFEVVVAGLLTHPNEIRPDPDPEIISVEIGEIDDVCGASERVCRRLADESLKSELTRTTRGTLNASDTLAALAPSAGDPQSSTTPSDRSKTMTLKEAAAALRVSDDTLQRMRKRDEIGMFKVASRWRVLASEVIRLRQARFENR